jgi:hypothetical protein
MVAKREICSSSRTFWKRFNLKAAAAPRLNAARFRSSIDLSMILENKQQER